MNLSNETSSVCLLWLVLLVDKDISMAVIIRNSLKGQLSHAAYHCTMPLLILQLFVCLPAWVANNIFDSGLRISSW
jgi:hypothetical protein